MEKNNPIFNEPYTESTSVINNLINKVYQCIGYCITPKGGRKDREDAVNFLAGKIRENNDLPDLAKAALISNARELIKKYCNQQDILTIGIRYLSKEGSVEKLDEDWINDFFEKAGNINDEQMKYIFGRILAETYNGHKASKSLIHKLYMMDRDIAQSFLELSKYKITLCAYDTNDNIIDETCEVGFFTNCFGWDVTSNWDINLIELSSIGLLAVEPFHIKFQNKKSLRPIKEIVIKYGENSVSIVGEGEDLFVNQYEPIIIPGGTICLTKDGKYLMNIIQEGNTIEQYFDSIKSCYRRNGYIINE